ncbi:Vaculolar membrane protein-domain-containing protein, partial [Blyttiomyces helicus]
EEDPPQNLNCKLVDNFAIFVQVTLASIALGSLLIKRARENPRRPLVVWGFDTSKQALAAGGVHFSNVVIAYFSGKKSEESANPCIWYFLNILLDTTIGVGFLFGFLRGLHYIAGRLHVTEITSGQYGNPPRLTAWFKQFVLFLTAWFFVKLTVVILLDVFPFFAEFAKWLLAPLARSGDTRLQVIVVMLIFPLIMNICQAWLIDTIIRSSV